MLSILNIAGYKFVSLSDTAGLRLELLTLCQQLELKGTILLSAEGINITLAGRPEKIELFKTKLIALGPFEHINFHATFSDTAPFKRLKVKLKKEIITFRQPTLDNTKSRASAVEPETLKRWLDDNKDIVLLDTRNEYEIEFGSFKNAVNLHINDFTEFAQAINQLPREKTIVMFCTGGIRCEKAALYMEQQGFNDVHQLHTGILGYFAKVGGVHYEGDCFVFDERIAVNPKLETVNNVSEPT